MRLRVYACVEKVEHFTLQALMRPEMNYVRLECDHTRSQALGARRRFSPPTRPGTVQQWERGYAARRSCLALESDCMNSSVPKAPGHHLLRNRRLYQASSK